MDWTEAVGVWAKERNGLAEAELFVRRLERLERKRDRHDGDGTSCTVQICGRVTRRAGVAAVKS